LIIGAVSIGAFIKAITGMGLPPIPTPVMAAFLGVEHAVVVIAGPAQLTNTWLLWEHRRGAVAPLPLRTARAFPPFYRF